MPHHQYQFSKAREVKENPMNIRFDKPARPRVLLLEGTLEHNGERYAFWFEHDTRDGATYYDLYDSTGHYDLPDDLDYDAFEAACQARVEAA